MRYVSFESDHVLHDNHCGCNQDERRKREWNEAMLQYMNALQRNDYTMANQWANAAERSRLGMC